MRFLRQGTAVTIVIGQFIDWSDAKSPVIDNDAFDPADLVCEIIKGSVAALLTLTKSGGDNDMNMTGHGNATLELTAANTDTLGHLRISITNAAPGGIGTDYILPFAEDFTVISKEAYDRTHGVLTKKVQDKTTLALTTYAADGTTPVLVENVTETLSEIAWQKADPA
jgi:hypothetical protein